MPTDLRQYMHKDVNGGEHALGPGEDMAGAKINADQWNDYLDDHTTYDSKALRDFLSKKGLDLNQQWVDWVVSCYDKNGDGKIGGRDELRDIRVYIMETTLQKRWLYYAGWLCANATHFFIGSYAVNAANSYYLASDASTAKTCDVPHLVLLEVAIRLLGAVMITETIIFFLVPVCGSCCSAPPPDSEADLKKKHEQGGIDGKIPLTARTGSILFLKGVESIQVVHEGCGNEYGFVFYFVEIILIGLQLTWLLSYLYAAVLTVMTHNCVVAPANRELWTQSMHVIVALFFFPLWSLLSRGLYGFVIRQCGSSQRARDEHKRRAAARAQATTVVVPAAPAKAAAASDDDARTAGPGTPLLAATGDQPSYGARAAASGGQAAAVPSSDAPKRKGAAAGACCATSR